MPASLPPRPSDREIDGLLESAVRAPSVLNSQPWRFVVERGAVLVHADRSRQLGALDPEGREMILSCGAAVLCLRVAARHAGWATDVLPFPVPEAPDLVAAVTFRAGRRPEGDDRLFRAVARRRTHRRAFTAEAVPDAVTADVARAAAAEGAMLHVFDAAADREALAGLVAEAVEAQAARPEVVDDLKRWLRPARDPRPDGVRDSAQGVWDRTATSRTPASAVARHKAGLGRDAPAVLVLTTAADAPPDWLAAGQALARALLVADDHGLAASYLNEPVEEAGPRAALARRCGGRVPQVMLRIGYPDLEPESSRRYVSDVTEHVAEREAAPRRGAPPGSAIRDAGAPGRPHGA